MINTTHNLRLQVWLYLLFISGLLTGLLGFVGHVWPGLAIPESLMVTMRGSLVLILGSLVMLSLMLQSRPLRYLSGSLLSIVGGYYAVRQLLAVAGLMAPAAQSSGEIAPMVCSLLWGLGGLIGTETRLRRLFAMLISCMGMAIGGYVLLMFLFAGGGENPPLIIGFTRIGAIFCLVFAAALALLCRLPWSQIERMELSAASGGALAVFGTFFLLVMASWGIHQERHNSARALVQHYAGMLEYELESSAELIGRMADRWAALDLEVPAALQRTELKRYFTDITALKSLLVLGRDGRTLLHESSNTGEQHWLARQMANPPMAQWINTVRAQGLAAAWHIPDNSRPLHAVLMIVPEGSTEALFFATFDLDPMWQPVAPASDNEFDFTLVSRPDSPSLKHAQRLEVFEHASVTLPGGPTLTVTASAGPASMRTLPGMLIPSILVLGLLVSYLLTIGRIVAVKQRQSTRALHTEEQRFRSLFDQSPDAVFEFTREGRYVALNDRAKFITGINDQDLGELHYQSVVTGRAMSRRDFETFDAAFQRTIEGSAQTFSVKFLNISGQWRDYECSFMPVLVNNAVVGLYSVVKDITERLQAQENQRLLTRSLESSDNAVLVVDVRDPVMPVVFVNAAFASMTGCSREEARASTLSMITGSMEEPRDVELIRTTIANGEAATFTVRNLRRNGMPFWNQLSLAPVKDEDGGITHYTAIMKDVSEKKEHERQLAYQATHDVLTGLANRALLEDHLEHDIQLARRSGKQLAVMFIDLDAFKPINDTLGHRIGDQVLINVARRLNCAIRPTDTLARFGGDEFVLLLPNLETEREAELVADRILHEVGQAHRVGSHELYVTASIGISFLPEDLDAPTRMLQQADMAMYKAKQQGRNAYVIFSGDLDEKLSSGVTLRNELQEALRDDQLFLNYQPKVDQYGRFCGLEALVRWRHPIKGLISPARFIPIAEETGQIMHLGHWVITQACRDARQLLDLGLLNHRVAVNLSPLQFHRPGFLASLQDILYRTSLPASCLELELTESILMRNSDAAIETLNTLKRMGITTSIDDFGTGYSSFSYLKDLPVESVKIDRNFVDNVISNRKDAAVCRGIIATASELGMTVVAEGVENREQFELLRGYGCDAFQGYYFSRPMGLDELIDWVRQHQNSDAV